MSACALQISNEPPSDMKSNMRRAFSAFTEETCARLSSEVKRTSFKSILFGLCFYHSLLLGRKKFGVGIGTGSGSGLGFCRGYSFNMGAWLARACSLSWYGTRPSTQMLLCTPVQAASSGYRCSSFCMRRPEYLT